MSGLLERLLARPDRNVGRSDFGTRVLASIALMILIGMLIPQAAVKFSLIKICLLITAELGLVSLMLGLFLKARTYFAGVQLFAASLIMLWLEKRALPWAAIAVGLLFFAVGVTNLLTRRSRLNQILGVSSIREVLVKEPAAVEPKNRAGAALQTLNEGGPR